MMIKLKTVYEENKMKKIEETFKHGLNVFLINLEYTVDMIDDVEYDINLTTEEARHKLTTAAIDHPYAAVIFGPAADIVELGGDITCKLYKSLYNL